ncbi:hypothetical protein LAZ67_3005196 [Cordylochernes scorpioides]|uniref:Uncharacterized protein n=1 Tax=Cordylochernes scorpioides TaxID=51811 RepID=A0ABY6KAH8_9ARAC|nr:hypothetical protein LAZ67_3005196 [Cordylochernes scorpioides]
MDKAIEIARQTRCENAAENTGQMTLYKIQIFTLSKSKTREKDILITLSRKKLASQVAVETCIKQEKLMQINSHSAIDPLTDFPELFSSFGKLNKPYTIEFKYLTKPYAIQTPKDSISFDE